MSDGLLVLVAYAAPSLLAQAFGDEIKRVPWGVTIIVAVWAVVAVLLVWRGRKVWAVARQTVLQAIRMKLAVALILFLVLLVAFMPVMLRHDNTLDGRIRILITYALYAAEFLLCVLTLFLSTAVLCSEVKEKQIYILDTKPIPRWCVLAGKWAGVMVIDAALLAAVGVILYLAIRHQARMPARGRIAIAPEMPAWMKGEIEQVRRENEVLHARMLRAREKVTPPLPDIRKMTDERFEELRQRGMLPKERSEEWSRMMLSNALANEAWAVPPAYPRMWVVGGLPRTLPRDEWLTIRFFYRGLQRPLKNEITGVWTVGRFDAKSGKFKVPHVTSFRATKKCEVYQDVSVRASLIDPETGDLTIVFYNPPEERQPVVLFPLGRTEQGVDQEGLAVLYPVGGLAVNLFRGMALIFTKLAFLAVLGLTCATFLTFHVASFTAFTLYALGLSTAFLIDIIGNVYVFGSSMVRPGTPMEPGDEVLRMFFAWALYVLPDFRPYDAAPFLSDGLAVPWGLVAYGTVVLIAVRGGILAALGGVIFHRRELAALDR